LIDIAPGWFQDTINPCSLGLPFQRSDSLPKALRGSAERKCVLEILFADVDAS